MKRILFVLLTAIMAMTLLPSVVVAADTLELEIGEGKDFETIEAAVNSIDDTYSEITYILYEDQTITTTSTKYEPDLAQGAAVVNIEKADGVDEVTVTLAGVYYGRFSAQGAKLNATGITFDDKRPITGERYDPWEFTYFVVQAASAEFTDCTFLEGVMVSIDTKFTDCYFTVKPQTYGEDTKVADDHYALWIHNYGDVVLEGCTFEDVAYGAIKSTWNTYGQGSDLTVSVSNSTFKDCGTNVAEEHRILHLDGAADVVVKNNTVIGCYIGEGETEYDMLVKNKINTNPSAADKAKVSGNPVTVIHECAAADKWTKNAEAHWHKCANETCREIFDYAVHTFTDWERNGYKNERFCSVCGIKQVAALTQGQEAVDNIRNVMKTLALRKFAVAIDCDEDAVVITNNTNDKKVISDLGDSALYNYMADVKYSFAAAEGYEIVSVTVDGVEADADDVLIYQIKGNHVIKVVTEKIAAEEPAVEAPADTAIAE